MTNQTNLAEHVFHVRVRDAGLVEGVEGEGRAVLVPKGEHLVLQADEVDVLVVEFVNLGHGVGVERGRREVLQLGTGDRRDEVEVVGAVEAGGKVLGDAAQVFVAGLAKIDGGHVGNGITRGKKYIEVEG